jgi:hypothetical protein
MTDAEDKTAEQLATEISNPQTAQVDPTDEGSQSPAPAPATRDELVFGKFKTLDEAEKGYKELERAYTVSRQASSTPAPQPVVPPTETLFDNDTEQGITSIVEARMTARLERERAAEFARRHKDDLADPLLRGAVLLEIQDANTRGEYMDQETALENAKKALETRLNPKVEAASKESFEEGKTLARRKEQAGAVGGTNASTPQKDDADLSAGEYAAKYGIPGHY